MSLCRSEDGLAALFCTPGTSRGPFENLRVRASLHLQLRFIHPPPAGCSCLCAAIILKELGHDERGVHAALAENLLPSNFSIFLCFIFPFPRPFSPSSFCIFFFQPARRVISFALFLLEFSLSLFSFLIKERGGNNNDELHLYSCISREVYFLRRMFKNGIFIVVTIKSHLTARAN